MLHVLTPLDVRVAFHTAGPIAIEPRFNGAYFTVGADLQIAGGTGTTSESYFSLNAGLGLGTTVAESIITVGARLGLSFFN